MKDPMTEYFKVCDCIAKLVYLSLFNEVSVGELLLCAKAQGYLRED